jgi:purine-nucleoside phosphorylase
MMGPSPPSEELTAMSLESLVPAETLAYLRTQLPAGFVPETVVVLGSGLAIWPDLEDAVDVPYEAIPHFPRSTVVGHAGTLSFGRICGHPVVIQRGRFHRYEGWGWQDVTMPISTLAALGAQRAILTNAAGGLNVTYAQGDLMLLKDHINQHPPEAEEMQAILARMPRPRLAYAPSLQAMARRAAAAQNVFIREGVYLGLLGPSYETPAEIAAFRRMGADAVGMSTTPESIWATALGMDVVAFSAITNVTHTTDELAATSHEEVIDVAKGVSRKLDALLSGMVQEFVQGKAPVNR